MLQTNFQYKINQMLTCGRKMCKNVTQFTNNIDSSYVKHNNYIIMST